MRKTSVQTLASWASGELKGNASVYGVSVDSRDVIQGDLFVCLIGEKVDGHKYAQAAIDKGAHALLVSRYLEALDIPQILVDDTLVAMGKMAKAYRESLSTFIIGITGSNGKTSTKDILQSCLSLVGKTISTHLNQNTEIGTYLNLFKLDDATKFGIFEFGLDLPNDIKILVDLMEPDAAILTSLAPAHMMNFRDLDHIADEKVEIFAKLKNKDFGFYQGDYKEYVQRLGDEFKSFGFNQDNDFAVTDVILSNETTDFKVNGESFTSNVLGKHQASNAAAVIALLTAMKIEPSILQQGLKNVELTSLRMQVKKHKKSTIILDAYKSNPSSLIYALEFMDAYEFSGKRYLVLSEMVELGDESLHAHKQVLDAIAMIQADGVYTLGEAFYKFKDDYPIHAFKDKEAFNTAVETLFNKEALILIKGSRSYALENLLGED